MTNANDTTATELDPKSKGKEVEAYIAELTNFEEHARVLSVFAQAVEDGEEGCSFSDHAEIPYKSLKTSFADTDSLSTLYDTAVMSPGQDRDNQIGTEICNLEFYAELITKMDPKEESRSINHTFYKLWVDAKRILDMSQEYFTGPIAPSVSENHSLDQVESIQLLATSSDGQNSSTKELLDSAFERIGSIYDLFAIQNESLSNGALDPVIVGIYQSASNEAKKLMADVDQFCTEVKGDSDYIYHLDSINGAGANLGVLSGLVNSGIDNGQDEEEWASIAFTFAGIIKKSLNELLAIHDANNSKAA